jgi:peptidoglycan hydrolase CwlO-like protein
VALANAEVMEVVRQALRSELVPVNQRLAQLSEAVEMQGGNIASLTDMVDDIGDRLKNVEAKESATQQRLARMREEFQQRQRARQAADQRSELSQEDYQDAAEAYDPFHPTDGPAREPQRPGLESPATGVET